MDNNFFGSVPRDYGKPSLTIFWFQENSWEPCFFYGEVQTKETADQMRPEEQVSRGSGGGGETRLSETAWTWFLLFITLRVGKKLLSHLIAYWAPLNNHQKESGNTRGRNNNLLSYYVLDVMVQHRFSANKINRKAREKKATVVWEWINDQQGKCFDLKTNLLTTNSWRKGREVSLCICISGIGGVRRMR